MKIASAGKAGKREIKVLRPLFRSMEGIRRF